MCSKDSSTEHVAKYEQAQKIIAEKLYVSWIWND